MANEERIQVLQGTLDLILLRALSTMGPQHAYGLATRLEQITDGALPLNPGTLYAALVRLEQKRWIKGNWDRTPSNRQAKFYAVTPAGAKALDQQTGRWNRLLTLMNKLLPGEL